MSGIQKHLLPQEFHSWTILEFGKEDYNDVDVVSQIFQDTDHENTTLAVNAFSLDTENIIMAKHTIDSCPKQVRIIENAGVNIIPLEFDVSRWLNQGIHCLCNALVRTGGYENYF